MSEKHLACTEQLDQETGRDLYNAVRKLHVAKGEAVVLDFTPTRSMDSRGGAWLVTIADHVRSRHGRLVWEGQEGQVAAYLTLIEPGLKAALRRHAPRSGLLEQLGDSGIRFFDEVRDFTGLLVDAVYWTLLAPFEGRGFRWGLCLDEMYEMGVRAVRIAAMMSFLLGLTIAMLSAAQLRTFGLGIYVADLVMIGFARELAAVITAVVVSARTGAAIAAELATMKVQEEIDALRGMGLNVTQFLVSPKLVALIVVMPCLVSIAMVAGILGGMVWGTLVLGYRWDYWLTETLNAATLGDIFQGLLKGFFFAVVIVLIGCHNGLRVEGGSRGVGLMTTRAVVQDSFLIILIDMVFAVVFYYALG
jgi:phospholipid/cholesterol/gamma-HCH transport system permease protein